MDDKKPKHGLKAVNAKADAERLKAHLRLIDDLACGPKKLGGSEADRPPKSDEKTSG